MAIKLSELAGKAGQKEEFLISILVQTGLSIGAGGSSGTIADKSALKDGRQRFIIPGSHLKGRLRHGCERLARAQAKAVCESPRAERMCPQHNSRDDKRGAVKLRKQIRDNFPDDYGKLSNDDLEDDKKARMFCVICRLFGAPSFTESPGLSGTLMFSDLVWEEDDYEETIRSRVTINRRRRTAEDERLFFIETAPTGTTLEFKGAIDCNRRLSAPERQLIAASLRQIYALGGGKSGGAGWVTIMCEELGLRGSLTVDRGEGI
jgi:CRISPR/Cas system CSM-associated protein Csm3 (group 7 of RAMP superfamily)